MDGQWNCIGSAGAPNSPPPPPRGSFFMPHSIPRHVDQILPMPWRCGADCRSDGCSITGNTAFVAVLTAVRCCVPGPTRPFVAANAGPRGAEGARRHRCALRGV